MDEAHLSKASYFDELVEDGEVTLARSQGLPLLAWKDLEGQEAPRDNSTYSSTGRPGLSK